MKFKVGDWVRLNENHKNFDDSIRYLPLGVGYITHIRKDGRYLITVECSGFSYVFEEDELIPLNEGIDET